MSPVRARRCGAASHGLLPGEPRTYLRALAVVGLIAGVITMHSLGLGHGPMAGHPMSAGTSQTSQMAAMDGTPEHPAPQDATSVMTEVIAEAMAEAEVVAGTIPAHGMAAMCLAVLPFLVLLLARILGFRVRGLGLATHLLAARRTVRSDRAPPAYRCPSLLKLCILRT